MSPSPILFAHGLEGSPAGRKASAIRQAGFELLCPDGRGLTLAQRIALLEPIAARLPSMILVGSSYGGLVAVWLAQRFSATTTGLILCAPALHRCETPVFTNHHIAPHIPIQIIHGRHDTIVPCTVSQRFAETHPNTTLNLVDDDHSLRTAIPMLLDAITACSTSPD